MSDFVVPKLPGAATGSDVTKAASDVTKAVPTSKDGSKDGSGLEPDDDTALNPSSIENVAAGGESTSADTGAGAQAGGNGELGTEEAGSDKESGEEAAADKGEPEHDDRFPPIPYKVCARAIDLFPAATRGWW